MPAFLTTAESLIEKINQYAMHKAIERRLRHRKYLEPEDQWTDQQRQDFRDFKSATDALFRIGVEIRDLTYDLQDDADSKGIKLLPLRLNPDDDQLQEIDRAVSAAKHLAES